MNLLNTSKSEETFNLTYDYDSNNFILSVPTADSKTNS